ncbi:MAG TPA: VWA domain-containing protein [Symbiobacteriaceae bacterium]|nr:VWA domain-containing protein [Symbiobacteriaceae bacterium]
MGLGPLLHQVPWHEKLRRTVVRRRGVRLGEAAVVSRQVHTIEAGSPHIVTILSTSDVGQAYYGRENPGDVIHIDIFHAVADVDHKAVAARLRQALAGVPASGEAGMELLDYFDLQTGTGGGRVTGELTYGQKASLRAAHRNHVHLAGRMTDEQLEHLVGMVGAVEQAVAAQGIELRRIEKLNHSRWSDGTNLDLSHYTDPDSDSFLRGNKGNSGGGGARGSEQGGQAAGEGTAGQSLRSGARGAGSGASGSAGAGGASGAAGGGAAASPGAAGGAPGGPADGPPATGWDALETERRLQAALDLSRKLGSPDEVKRVLDELSREQGWSSLYGSGSSQAPFIINQLESEGLLKRDIRGLRLTDAGKELAAYLDRHLRDVKLRFRKLIRRMPAATEKKTRRPGQGKAKPSADVRYGPIRGTAPAEPGAWLGDLAVPETVRTGLKRTRLERIQSGGPALPGIRLERQDIHVHLRSGEQPLNICLLIDASASMAGRRILAAKHLARHLLVSTRDRVAVIAFQERDVRVYVPFTRDWSQVEDGLSRIQPMGLTPLAHGLTQSMDLIRQSRVRRPLLLLITDGIPTVPKWSVDPLADALEAARCVGAGRVPFGCIGLQPSRRYLEELVRVAGGTLHVVEELDEEALVTIAHHERIRITQKAR